MFLAERAGLLVALVEVLKSQCLYLMFLTDYARALTFQNVCHRAQQQASLSCTFPLPPPPFLLLAGANAAKRSRTSGHTRRSLRTQS